MDGICESKMFTKTEIRKINACRLYLQVTLVSDISTTCGRKILPCYYQGNKQQRPNRPFNIYPRQNKPNSVSWALWRKAFNAIFLRNNKQYWKTPLGAWHRQREQSQLWESYVDLEYLYQRMEWEERFTRHTLLTINQEHGIEIEELHPRAIQSQLLLGRTHTKYKCGILYDAVQQTRSTIHATQAD